jgi:hypothetical protein
MSLGWLAGRANPEFGTVLPQTSSLKNPELGCPRRATPRPFRAPSTMAFAWCRAAVRGRVQCHQMEVAVPRSGAWACFAWSPWDGAISKRLRRKTSFLGSPMCSNCWGATSVFRSCSADSAPPAISPLPCCLNRRRETLRRETLHPTVRPLCVKRPAEITIGKQKRSGSFLMGSGEFSARALIPKFGWG